MENSNQVDWITNIEESASRVEDIYGHATVTAVFERYRATSLDGLNPKYYSEVFSDLEQLIND